MQSVLLIDDDNKLGAVLTDYCQRFAIELTQALTPRQGLTMIKEHHFDALILDVMLPEMDGFELIKTIRRDSDIPIVMLTARGDVTDRIVGLELGANDYLPKPFDPRELVARVQGNIKRHQSALTKPAEPSGVQTKAPQRFEGFSIDELQREVRVEDTVVELTTMEFELLILLMSEPGRAFSRDEILARLKGTQNELFSRSVDILVSRLRAKLKPAVPIRTIHGAGYAFIARRPADQATD